MRFKNWTSILEIFVVTHYEWKKYSKKDPSLRRAIYVAAKREKTRRGAAMIAVTLYKIFRLITQLRNTNRSIVPGSHGR